MRNLFFGGQPLWRSFATQPLSYDESLSYMEILYRLTHDIEKLSEHVIVRDNELFNLFRELGCELEKFIKCHVADSFEVQEKALDEELCKFRKDIDAKLKVIQEQIDALDLDTVIQLIANMQTIIDANTQKISAMDTQLQTEISNFNNYKTSNDTRVTNVENNLTQAVTDLNTKLDNYVLTTTFNASQSLQDGKILANTTDVSNIKTEQITQNSRLQTIETVMGTIDPSLPFPDIAEDLLVVYNIAQQNHNDILELMKTAPDYQLLRILDEQGDYEVGKAIYYPNTATIYYLMNQVKLLATGGNYFYIHTDTPIVSCFNYQNAFVTFEDAGVFTFHLLQDVADPNKLLITNKTIVNVGGGGSIKTYHIVSNNYSEKGVYYELDGELWFYCANYNNLYSLIALDRYTGFKLTLSDNTYNGSPTIRFYSITNYPTIADTPKLFGYYSTYSYFVNGVYEDYGNNSMTLHHDYNLFNDKNFNSLIKTISNPLNGVDGSGLVGVNTNTYSMTVNSPFGVCAVITSFNLYLGSQLQVSFTGRLLCTIRFDGTTVYLDPFTFVSNTVSTPSAQNYDGIGVTISNTNILLPLSYANKNFRFITGVSFPNRFNVDLEYNSTIYRHTYSYSIQSYTGVVDASGLLNIPTTVTPLVVVGNVSITNGTNITLT